MFHPIKLSSISFLLLSFCFGTAVAATLEESVASDHRSSSYAARDQFRHPLETLKFDMIAPENGEAASSLVINLLGSKTGWRVVNEREEAVRRQILPPCFTTSSRLRMSTDAASCSMIAAAVAAVNDANTIKKNLHRRKP